MLVGAIRKAGQRPGRGSELYVQPAELARKLVKEMEDHKVSRATRVSVRNRYTVFLCPEDYERLHDREEALIEKLERHLAKHVRAKKYDCPDEISVVLVLDEDLTLGHFGILGERDAPGLAEREPALRARPASPLSLRETEPHPVVRVAAAPTEPAPVQRPRANAETAWPAAGPAPTGRPRGGTTEIIPPEDAARMNLAWQTLVVKSGDREREFTKGRVIVGRGRDVDFRIDDPNVSRQHAAIFWSEGAVMIEDLGSTNGTMVNGYPVSSTVVRPGDAIVIGDCRLTVETR